MSSSKRSNLLLMVAIAVFFVMVVFEIAYGDDHYDDDGDIVTSDVLVDVMGGNSRGYAVSGGDMDINDCLATESYLFGLYQRTKPNYLCMADKAQAKGELVRAAEFRCIYWGVRRAQGGKDECIKRLTYDNIPPAIKVLVGAVPDDRYVEQQEEIEYLREENASIVGQIEYITQQIQRAPTQIDAGAARRAKSRAAYEKALTEGTEQ